MKWRVNVAKPLIAALVISPHQIALAQFTISGESEPEFEDTALDRPLKLDLDYRATLTPLTPEEQISNLQFGQPTPSGEPRTGFGRDLGGGWVSDPALLHRSQNPEAGRYHELNRKLIGVDLRRQF